MPSYQTKHRSILPSQLAYSAHPPPNPNKIAAGTAIHLDFQIPSAGFNGSFGLAFSYSLSNLMRSTVESGSLWPADEEEVSFVVEGTRVSDESFDVGFDVDGEAGLVRVSMSWP